MKYNRLLRRGSIGKDVTRLQEALVILGYDPKGVDGSFGPGCYAAVRKFQKDNKLVVDGLVGPATINKLNEMLKRKDTIPIKANKSKYYKIGNAHVIETSPNNIEIKILGNTLQNVKRFGMNGTFFDTPRPHLANSCWAIATNEGKPIGGNSMFNSYNHSIKRGTLIYYKDGSIGNRKVNSINEYTKEHIWSIGGYTILPDMDFKGEKMAVGINYRTAHSYIGYKGRTIFLIVKPNHMIKDIVPLAKQLGLEVLILLDGGGSSQLNHPKGSYKSSRRINSAVLLKQI